jgi:hypothetical protein
MNSSSSGPTGQLYIMSINFAYNTDSVISKYI